VFFGETAITLDSKGRMAIPTRYREELAAASQNRLVLTYSPFDSGALWLYPEGEWQSVRDSVMALSTFDSSHRSLQRRLVGSATPIEPKMSPGNATSGVPVQKKPMNRATPKPVNTNPQPSTF